MPTPRNIFALRVWLRCSPDGRDLLAIGVLYALLVGAFRLAFQGFTAQREIALFVSFAVVGLFLLGLAVPVVYTVWLRRRTLDCLGVGLRNWKESMALGIVLAWVQFFFTLKGYALPEPVNWITLMLMSLVVGLFEAIFFRGFIQNRLEASFGIAPAVIGAAALYSLYHVGYQMGAGEMSFLFGLGIAYAIIFRLTGNILVLWPFLIPMGSFFNNLRAGDIQLPWSSMIGFGEIMLAMGIVLFMAYRRQLKMAR